MKENKLTQREMADKMGCGQSTVGNVLTEKFEPGFPFIKKFCEVTGMSLAQVFSPDPKQYGLKNDSALETELETVRGFVTELTTKCKELTEEKKAMGEHIKQLKTENEELNEAYTLLEFSKLKINDEKEALEKENEKLREKNETLDDENAILEKEDVCKERRINELVEAIKDLEKENVRLVQEAYNAKNEPVKFDKWILNVDSTDCTGYIETGGDQIEVYDVENIDPFEKKVLVKLYFDEIIIK